ncbi:MAG TPA: hypothetical protein VGB51_04960 [Actinomycetota bacterium]
MLVAVLVALGLATLAVLVIAAISLARQGSRLAASIADFQRELRPLLEEIRADADRMESRLEGLQKAREGARSPNAPRR